MLETVGLRCCAVVLVGIALEASALADEVAGGHAHAALPHDSHLDPYAAVLGGHAHHGGTSYGASVGLVIADYKAPLYSGDYQGANVGARWMRDRFGIAATLPAYRLTRNGPAVDGIGDLVVHGHASIVTRGAWSMGAMMMVSLPTGNDEQGLGMGHVMWMPEVFGGWTARRIALDASLGAGYMMGGHGAHAEHGQLMWPLVSPMNAAEVTYGANATVALAKDLGAGVRLSGAVPIGDGTTRVITGIRVIWIAGRTATSFEVQHGTVGDPFGIRGTVETTIRFK